MNPSAKYSEAISEILVFRTSIQPEDAAQLSAALNAETKISHWTIDFNDIDNVLCVHTDQITASHVVELISRLGFYCEELPD